MVKVGMEAQMAPLVVTDIIPITLVVDVMVIMLPHVEMMVAL